MEQFRIIQDFLIAGYNVKETVEAYNKALKKNISANQVNLVFNTVFHRGFTKKQEEIAKRNVRNLLG